MDSGEFDFVKYEKSKALRRYIVSRKLGTLIRVTESLCVLFLFGYYLSDVSLVIDVGHGFLLRQLKALITPLSAFLLGNGIVLVVFVLSGGGKVCGEVDDQDDEGIAVFRHVCKELESLEKSSPGESCPLRTGTNSPEVTGSEEMIIFSLSTEEVEEVTVVPRDVDEIPTAVKEMAAESDTKPREDETGSPTGCDGKIETDSPIIPVERSSSNNRGVLGRSNSEVTSSGKRASKTALGRWASENGRVPATGGDHGHSPIPSQQSSDDDLSIVEFNLKVERYIAGKKWLLWKEKVADCD
ncbi:hypothetical protein MLD38_034969 [Melastoma candidum]|uniref:Uncharacterized protein n=1 Tax=Melastoma candidum TaxID=119954 RepID=A0ACB9MC62_9MYRT|nr:hypothetical protein MLD38_034969 [Melastoma candidum]